MAFVVVLSYSRRVFVHFSLNARMDAFLQGRKPNFQQFRMQAKRELASYVDGFERNLNEPPEMRKLHK